MDILAASPHLGFIPTPASAAGKPGSHSFSRANVGSSVFQNSLPPSPQLKIISTLVSQLQLPARKSLMSPIAWVTAE